MSGGMDRPGEIVVETTIGFGLHPQMGHGWLELVRGTLKDQRSALVRPWIRSGSLEPPNFHQDGPIPPWDR